jgi:hypothetical protein
MGSSCRPRPSPGFVAHSFSTQDSDGIACSCQHAFSVAACNSGRIERTGATRSGTRGLFAGHGKRQGVAVSGSGYGVRSEQRASDTYWAKILQRSCRIRTIRNAPCQGRALVRSSTFANLRTGWACMQYPVELANRILDLLKDEESRDAISAIKIAMILLPVKPSARLLNILNETPQALEEFGVATR